MRTLALEVSFEEYRADGMWPTCRRRVVWRRRWLDPVRCKRTLTAVACMKELLETAAPIFRMFLGTHLKIVRYNPETTVQGLVLDLAGG